MKTILLTLSCAALLSGCDKSAETAEKARQQEMVRKIADNMGKNKRDELDMRSLTIRREGAERTIPHLRSAVASARTPGEAALAAEDLRQANEDLRRIDDKIREVNSRP